MSTILTYLAVLLAIGVLYGLTRPRKGTRQAPWLAKFLPQAGSGVQPGVKDRLTLPREGTSPSEVAQILEEIYDDFTAESARLEGEMQRTMGALQEETRLQLATLQAELAELRKRIEKFSDFDASSATQVVQASPTVDKPVEQVSQSGSKPGTNAAVRKEPPSREGHNEYPEIHYFDILDELVRGTEPMLICDRLGVTLEEVELVERLMGHPSHSALHSPQQ